MEKDASRVKTIADGKKRSYGKDFIKFNIHLMNPLSYVIFAIGFFALR